MKTSAGRPRRASPRHVPETGAVQGHEAVLDNHHDGSHLAAWKEATCSRQAIPLGRRGARGDGQHRGVSRTASSISSRSSRYRKTAVGRPTLTGLHKRVDLAAALAMEAPTVMLLDEPMATAL